MIPRLVLVISLAAFVCNSHATAQDLGAPPPAGLQAVDVYTAFRLPPLRDTAEGGLISVLSTTQVGVRAATLGLTGTSAVDAWSSASALLQSAPPAPCSGSEISFTGTTASELNAILAGGCANVLVTSAALNVDQPIEIQGHGASLHLGGVMLSSKGSFPYLLRIDAAGGVTIDGGKFVSGIAGILVNSSSQVQIQNAAFQGLSSDGIVVTNSTNVRVTRNRFSGLAGAGIVVHRGSSLCLVDHNHIEGNTGFSNVAAAIVLTDREVDLASNPQAIFGPDGYWVVSEAITARLHPPHDNVIAFNSVSRNAASGIYVDGGIRDLIVGNSIDANTKEGICLDNGSAANVVASNVVTRNGNRWGEPDWVLSEDSVLNGGRLPDGTAAEKLPGISLDNAMYNVVFSNNVSHNFGGGIKIVRTGYFNLIGLNTVYSDNDGANRSFHFFGIELGATPGDNSSAQLDYTPSRGNIVFSNLIRGSHYSGIFFDAGSYRNNVFDNTIMDALDWALESVSVMANDTLNNLTNLPSRNIGSGIDPALVTLGQPVLDPGQ